MNTKLILGGVVVLVIIAAAFYSFEKAKAPENMDGSAYPMSTTSASDTSDDALRQDAAAIDAQFRGMDDDSAAVDQGFDVQVQ